MAYQEREQTKETDETESLNGEGNRNDGINIDKYTRRYNLGISLFCVLNVLLISLIGFTASYVCSEKNSIAVHHADTCVPCEDLRLHPDDTIAGIERRGKNKTVCCVENKNGPDALFGNYIDHWLKKKLATDTNRQFVRYKCVDKSSMEPHKPIIKLVGKHEKQKAENNKLHWDGDSEMAIVPADDSITHHKEHGFIEIKKSGIYEVYSQVVLDHDTNAHTHNNGPDIYFHSVILIESETSQYMSPREINILKTYNSHCECKTNRQTITSYLGGAFQLSEGDKLAVRVHNKTEIVPVPHMNFFGAYML